MHPEIRIENTNYCNCKCVMCPRDKMTREKVIMPYGKFENLVLQGKKLGAKMVSIFGYGEPLVDREIAGKVELCTQLGLKTNITTNASLLTRGMSKDLLKSGLTQIRFSVHGLGTSYEKIHKGLRWYPVIENIRTFIHLNDNRCETHVTCIPMNGETIYDIRGFWEPMVNYIEIWKPHNWGGHKNYRRVKPRKKTCGRPFNGPAQIMADGKMIVCCFDTDGAMVIGDTNKDMIKDILKGDKLSRIKEKHKSGDFFGLLCETCDQLNDEQENPLLYSNRDPERKLGRTSSFKININKE